MNDNCILDELQDYEKWKKQTNLIADYMSTSRLLFDKADKLLSCGSYIAFSKSNKTDIGAFSLVGANFCRERLCPMCQRRKAMRVYAQTRIIGDKLSADGYDFIHLVLTTRNVSDDELSVTIDKLFKGSRKLFNNSIFKRGIKGVFRSLEVSYNQRDDTYHPHLHCLCAVKHSYFKSRYYISHEQMRELWSVCLGVDYLPMVHVGRCDDDGFAEVAKYSVKPLSLELEPKKYTSVLDALHKSLKCRRLIQCYGVIRTVASDCKLSFDDDEVLNIDIDAVNKFSYNFAHTKYEQFK